MEVVFIFVLVVIRGIRFFCVKLVCFARVIRAFGGIQCGQLGGSFGSFGSLCWGELLVIFGG
jgi:hypothetical protein